MNYQTSALGAHVDVWSLWICEDFLQLVPEPALAQMPDFSQRNLDRSAAYFPAQHSLFPFVQKKLSKQQTADITKKRKRLVIAQNGQANWKN